MPKTGRGSILHKFMGKQMLKKKKQNNPAHWMKNTLQMV